MIKEEPMNIFSISLINVKNAKLSLFGSLILSPMLGFIFPVKHLLMPLFWLVVLDILSGVYKSRIIQKKPLTSKRFFERKSKVLLIWAIGLVTMLLADKFLLEIKIEGSWASKGYCVFYGIYETISILENLADSGLPGAKGILRLLRGKLPDNLNKALEEQEDED
jgi:phage-related holin